MAPAGKLTIKFLIWPALCLAIYILCFRAYAPQQPDRLLPFFRVHLVVASLTAAWAFINFHRYGRDAMGPLCAILILVLGPFGAVAVCLFSAMSLIFRNKEGDLKELLAMLYPEENEGNAEQLYRKLKRARNTRRGGVLIPFRDVMAWGTPRQKQKAIENIARNFTPEFAPALMDAISDPDNFVRVQAASAMQWLETRFHNEVHELESSCEREPEKRETLLKLGDLFLRHAQSGLSDRASAGDLLKKALTKYQSYLALQPDDYQARIACAKTLQLLGRHEEVLNQLRNLNREFPEASEVLVLYAESLFHGRRYYELRKLLQSYRADKVISLPCYDAVKDVLKLWTDRSTLSHHEQACSDS